MQDSVELLSKISPSNLWESKILEAKAENEILKSKLLQTHEFYTEKFDELEKKIKYLTERKNYLEQSSEQIIQKKKEKIKYLKTIIEEKDSEIKLLQTSLNISKNKINSLRKNRQQSVDLIKDLEEEIMQSKRMNGTPTHCKVITQQTEERRSLPSSREFKIQTFNFKINEISEISGKKDSEQEKFMERQSKLLKEEMHKNKKLLNKMKSLENENLLLENDLNEMNDVLSDLQKKFNENSKIFVDRIEKYKIENEDLRAKIKEYQDRDSGFNTSDYECTGNLKDELSGLNVSQRSKCYDRNSHDDYSIMDLRLHIDNAAVNSELKKENKRLIHENSEMMYEIQKLKKEIERRNKSALELNRILTENKKMMDSLKCYFNFQYISDEIKNLNLQKNSIVTQIEEKKNELSKLKEKVLLQKLIQKKPFLEDSLEGKSEETIKPIRKSSFIKNTEEYKRKRKIASWGYDVLGSSINN